MNIENLKEVGKALREAVGDLRFAKNARDGIKVGAGGDTTFPMDKAAEDTIVRYLENLGEPMTIISEELGIHQIDGGTMRVIVDPVDGSKNAINGLALFCASIAVADGPTIGDVNMGYVINLVSGDEYWAQKGSGTYLNGNRVETRRDEKLEMVLVECQNPARELPGLTGLLSMVYRMRCLGSIALDLAYVASGSAGALITMSKSRPFDYAAGLLLVREAGGIVTDVEGNSIDHLETGLKRSSSLLASANGVIHEKALLAIDKHRTPTNIGHQKT